MANARDPSCRPVNCPLTAAGFHPGDETELESRLWANVADDEIEPCVQDLDASQNPAVFGLGDCTLDCCHCALRWYARRIINQRDN